MWGVSVSGFIRKVPGSYPDQITEHINGISYIFAVPPDKFRGNSLQHVTTAS